MTDKDHEEHHAGRSSEVEEDDTEQTTEQRTVRKGERVRTLTERGKALQEEKLKGLQHKFAVAFEKWRNEVRLSKVILRKEASESELKELINNVTVSCNNTQTIYEQIRKTQTPDTDVRRKVDVCSSLSTFIVRRAGKQLEGDIPEGDEEPWPDVGSFLGSENTKAGSKSRRSKGGSGQSCSQSIKRMEAEAEAAASLEILTIMEEHEKVAAQLRKLEHEDLERQQAIDENWYLSLMAPNTKGPKFAWLDPSSLYCNSQAFSDCVKDLLKPFKSDSIDLVAGIDAMGFILGSAVATSLGKGFLAIRKAGNLCVETQTQEYTDYSGRDKQLEVRVDVLRPGLRVLIVDQWIETGGTMKAAIKLVERQGASVVGVAVVAIENSKGGKWIKENYKHSHCIPEKLQSQIDRQYLESFKDFNSLDKVQSRYL